MCDFLNIPKSTYYYHADLTDKRAQKAEDKEISKEIARIFKESRNNYGTCKIKKELWKSSLFRNMLYSYNQFTFIVLFLYYIIRSIIHVGGVT